MSELDELRRQNKELKRLLENALALLEKSKRVMIGQTQPVPTGIKAKGSVGRSSSKTRSGTAASKNKRRNKLSGS
jgi:hypothetical protein